MTPAHRQSCFLASEQKAGLVNFPVQMKPWAPDTAGSSRGGFSSTEVVQHLGRKGKFYMTISPLLGILFSIASWVSLFLPHLPYKATLSGPHLTVMLLPFRKTEQEAATRSEFQHSS